MIMEAKLVEDSNTLKYPLCQIYDYKGKKITISTEEDAEQPNWDASMGFLTADYNGLNLIKNLPLTPDKIREIGGEIIDGYHIFGVDIYDHSGICLALRGEGKSFDSWDTTTDHAFICISVENSAKDRESARKIAEGVVENWNNYLSGEVYAYDTDNDSCGGFYGESGLKEAISNAEDSIDWQEKQEIKKHIAKVKAYIKKRVPLDKRKSFAF